jgi:NADPH-dependent ferric siderophore reductase
MRTFKAEVMGRALLTPNMARVTLRVEDGYASTRIPDEYIRVLIPQPGTRLSLPVIDDEWNVTYPDGPEPDARVYSVSDHRVINGRAHLDVDVVLHDGGIGSTWASTCQAGDAVGVIEPHGLYKAQDNVGWQLLVSDHTGLPAVARILRELNPGQRARVHMVLTDPRDQILLPSAADVEVTWHVVGDVGDVSDALVAVVRDTELPASDRYVWMAGEARASRAVRKYLRRELGWAQADFMTCGYWQIDQAKWAARYEQVADQVLAEAREAKKKTGDDEGAYLDAIDEIYESVGL